HLFKRALIIAGLRQQNAEIVVGLRQAWIQSQRLRQFNLRILTISREHVCVAEIGQRGGSFRFKLHRPLESLSCLHRRVAMKMNSAKGLVSIKRSGIDRDRSGYVLLCE